MKVMVKAQAALLAAAAGVLSGALAAVVTWTRTDGGDLALADNWGGTLPGESDNAVVPSGQSAPLTLTSAESLTVGLLNLSASLELALGSGHVLTATQKAFFNGVGQSYLLSSGTLKTTSDRIFLGDDANAKGNVLTVAGPDARLSAGTYFSLSPNSGQNRLVVRDGATFEGAMQVGANTSKAGGNEIVVTGEGTSFRVTSSDALRLVQGSDNVFAVSNKATAAFAGSAKWASVRVGIFNEAGGSKAAGDRNRVLVDDATLTADYGIWIGESSSSNTLEIANGGRVLANADIQLGRSRHESDAARPGPLTANRLLARGLGNWLCAKGGVAVGFGAGSCASALEVPADAALAYCGPLSMGCDAASVGNRVTVGGELSVTNAASANWEVGTASTGNVFSVSGASARAAFANTTVRVGATAAASNNVFRVCGGATLALTNAAVVVGLAGAENANEATFANASVTAAQGSSLTIAGRDGRVRLDNAALADADGTTRVTVDGGSSSASRGTGGRLELVNGAVLACSRLILGDYSRDTRLDVSNATLRVKDFQPNYKDLTDSNCQVHFWGRDPHLVATNFNFYGDATFNFHVPREGYALTNPDGAVVACPYVTRRDNAQTAKTGKPLIRVTGEEGLRTRGHWTLMKAKDAKWNFANAGVTADDVECGPGIRAVVTEKTIEVYVSSQRGAALIVR